MTQDISRRWDDKQEAKHIKNYPDPESVPSSLKRRLVVEFVVEADCPHCHHSDHYYSTPRNDIVECTADDCGEEFLLP